MQAQTVYVLRQWPHGDAGEATKILGIYDSELLAQNTLRDIMKDRQEDLGGKFVTNLNSAGERIYSIMYDMHYSISPMMLNAVPEIPRLAVLEARLKVPPPTIARTAANVIQPEIVGPLTVANISFHHSRIRRTIDEYVNQMLRDNTVIKSIYGEDDDDKRYEIIEESLREVFMENRAQHRLDIFTEYGHRYIRLKILEIMLRADPTFAKRDGDNRLRFVREELAYSEDPRRLIA